MKATLTLVILMVFSLGTASPAAAQTGTISGTLTNALSGDPLPNITVTLQSGGTMQQARTGVRVGPIVWLEGGLDCRSCEPLGETPTDDYNLAKIFASYTTRCIATI
jgi:hypothetical protein